MPKITFLLGAGASCYCLPVVDKIPQAMNEFREALVHLSIDPSIQLEGISGTLHESRVSLINDCTFFIEEVQKQGSVDVYARKLSITKKIRDYRALKAILSCVFVREQFIRPTGHRYVVFFLIP